MKILVTGATGNVGSQAVRALTEHGADVRAFVRDPAAAQRRLGPDTELAVGDLADRAAVDRALRGVDRLILACGNVPGQVELEGNAIDAARSAGVDLVVKLSSPAPDVDSPLIFDSWHGQIERHLLRSGLPWVLLRPRTYLTNLLGYAETIRQTGTIFAPAGDAAVSYVDPIDVGSAAAAAVLDDHHQGVAYTLTGPEAITHHRIAQELSRATGRRVDYVAVTDADARSAMLKSGMPDFVADFILGVHAAQRAGAMTSTTDSIRLLTGQAPQTIAQFARDHAEAFTPAAPDHHPDLSAAITSG